MQTRPVVLAILAAAGLAACIPGLPNTTAAPPLPANAFTDADPLPAGAPAVKPSSAATASAAPAPGGASTAPTAPPATPPSGDDGTPFTDPRYQDVVTATRFTPAMSFGFDGLKRYGEPTITSDVYQVKGEVELRELRMLLEKASFRYDKLKIGDEVGDGQMDVGTPPKMTLKVSVTCTDTDRKTYGTFRVEASGPLVTIYLADVRVKDNDGNLSIVSVSNFSRANDGQGKHTTDASARVVQRFRAGYVVLPDLPYMRMRALAYSETDPAGGGSAMRVVRQTLLLEP